jgi:hypothetical protein
VTPHLSHYLFVYLFIYLFRVYVLLSFHVKRRGGALRGVHLRARARAYDHVALCPDPQPLLNTVYAQTTYCVWSGES